MTYYITQPCIDTLDLSCVDVCPVDCIHCGACEPACPVTAIFAEDDLPEDQSAFAEINVLWFQDKEAARAKVPS